MAVAAVLVVPTAAATVEAATAAVEVGAMIPCPA